MEAQYHIPHHCEPTYSDYVQVQRSLSTEKQNYVAEALWATSTRCLFLLKLKAKYAGLMFMRDDSIIGFTILCRGSKDCREIIN